MVGYALVADESVIHVAFFRVGEIEPNATMGGIGSGVGLEVRGS